MKRPAGAELRIRRQANKTFVPRLHMGEPARGSPLPHNRVSGYISITGGFQPPGEETTTKQKIDKSFMGN